MNHRSRLAVRDATVADLEAVLRLDQALIAFDRRFDPTLAADWSFSEEGMAFFSARLSGSEGVAFVAEDGGEVVAYLVGAMDEAESYRDVRRVAELECLYVDARYRGRGIGEKLAQRFEEWALAQGVGRLRVVVSAANEGALRFYRRTGFESYDAVLEKRIDGPAATPVGDGHRDAGAHI